MNGTFEKLRILRLENNNIKENSASFKEIVDKYNKDNTIIVTKTKIDEIKKKYKIEYNENTEILELERVEEEEKWEIKEKEEEEDELLLINLFIIISHKNENRITTLKLANCKISNPSILKRIQFNFLKELDLSSNNITNLNFLKGLKAKKLEILYLFNNYIYDLSLLDNIKKYFPFLIYINLENNIFNPKELKYKEYAKYLYEKNIHFIYSYIRSYVDSKFNADIVQPKLSKNNYNNSNAKCFYCKGNRNIYLYCYDCKIEFCRKCEIKHRKTNNIHTRIIKVNEKKFRCLEQYDKEDF